MTIVVICVGGQCAGQSVAIDERMLEHGRVIEVEKTSRLETCCPPHYTEPMVAEVERHTYKLGVFREGDSRVWTLHPVNWDGLGVIEHLLQKYRKACNG
jgi:hypothetical protein